MVAILRVASTGSSLGKNSPSQASGMSMSSGLTPQLRPAMSPREADGPPGGLQAGPQATGRVGGAMRMRATKAEMADAFLANLRARKDIDVDQDGFAAAIKGHFESLPSRYASRPPQPRHLASRPPAAPPHTLTAPPSPLTAQIRAGRQHLDPGRP